MFGKSPRLLQRHWRCNVKRVLAAHLPSWNPSCWAPIDVTRRVYWKKRMYVCRDRYSPRARKRKKISVRNNQNDWRLTVVVASLKRNLLVHLAMDIGHFFSQPVNLTIWPHCQFTLIIVLYVFYMTNDWSKWHRGPNIWIIFPLVTFTSPQFWCRA